MNKADYIEKRKQLSQLAIRYMWNAAGTDENCGRVSFTDDLAVYRIDIYTSKMTVCILPQKGKPTFLKRQSIAQIEEIMKNPYKY